MMAGNKEHIVCVKFCFLLGKSAAAETVLMLQEAFQEEALSKTQVYNGIHVWKGVKCHVRTIQDLTDLQPAKMMKILKKFTTQSIQIIIGPLMRFLR